MSIYKKLAKARVNLQESGIKRSGVNSFSKYTYFELKDFLPDINKIFNDLGLCGVVSFTSDLATLTIYDSDSDGKIEFTSPMAKATLKGCHEIQNLGAVETYQRRYLYMMALEIVEGDILDENTGNPKTQPVRGEQGGKDFTSLINDRLSKCNSKDELSEIYGRLEKWVRDKHPEKLDDFNIIYNDKVLSFI